MYFHLRCRYICFLYLFIIMGAGNTAISQVLPDAASDTTVTDSSDNSSSVQTFPSSQFAKPTPGQMLKFWVLQHQNEIWQEIEITDNRYRPYSEYGFNQLFQQYNQAPHVYPGIEMRESSIYIPQNVRDYSDYKMGRDRYLPVATPLLVGYMLYHVGRYASHFFDDGDEADIWSTLSDTEQQMLQLLQSRAPLDLDTWYDIFLENRKSTSISLTEFTELVARLEKTGLLKPRVFDDGTIKYFPAIEPSEFRLKLKK